MEWGYFLAGAAIGAAVVMVAAAVERRRQLALFRACREADREALVETLAGGLAHEIRNPLSSLRMNLQLLREDWEHPITEREQKGLRKIDLLLRETERLNGILSDLLRFASHHTLNLQRTDLNALAGETLDFLTPQAERARIRLRRELDPTIPRVDIDPGLIRQALLNLLINAQQALGPGGEIAVRTSSNGQAVHLSVTDNGTGIPPENLDQIFNLYFSTRPGGTGLGLPMVKKIVEEHGGSVQVRSEPGKGSTFTLCLKKPAS